MERNVELLNMRNVGGRKFRKPGNFRSNPKIFRPFSSRNIILPVSSFEFGVAVMETPSSGHTSSLNYTNPRKIFPIKMINNLNVVLQFRKLRILVRSTLHKSYTENMLYIKLMKCHI